MKGDKSAMESMGKVSIITPLYNCENFISSTIESVLRQTYTDWEMIIIDDKSTDSSLQKAKVYAQQDDRIKVIEMKENSGAAIARNTGIEKSNGKYIAFLDSDDLWLPKKLENQVKFMSDNEIAFSYTAYKKINEDGTYRGIVSVPESVTYNDLLNTNSIGCLTAMYDVSKLGKLYMPNIAKRQDYVLWLKILKNEKQAFGFNIPLAIYRVRNESISSDKLEAARYQWMVYREIEQLNLFESIYRFINYGYYGFKKYMV